MEQQPHATPAPGGGGSQSRPSFPRGFRPELGLPWLSHTMQGLSPAQIEKRMKGCRSFVFLDNTMAPALPKGTQVVLRPVECKCKLTEGKVYVLFRKDGELVAYGRLADMADSEDAERWGVRFTLHWEDGREAMEPWIWPHPACTLYALAYYESVNISAFQGLETPGSTL